YLMWWQRRPKHDPTRRFGMAPGRGALAGAPWWAVAGVALVAIGIGIVLPLVGASLVVFLIVDALLGLRARRLCGVSADDCARRRIRFEVGGGHASLAQPLSGTSTRLARIPAKKATPRSVSECSLRFAPVRGAST